MELTPAEKRFLLKAYEEKVVSDSTLLAAAVANGKTTTAGKLGSLLRKKGKKPKKLWQKCPQHADQQERQRIVEAAKKIEATEGKAWVDLIYQANGMRRRKAVNTDA